ncbi:universal stress protein [Rossellomorea arthrocnemi]|jgi:nucleotide-binding universal stress UspA family protein|uniref:universal stress protein n=1 Tax=Rossellomorea arthrocnemi TaxID=2769542 RepID=UPI00191A3FB3|nr:universal stress protein [Rossellomorea arthrocnemi]
MYRHILLAYDETDGSKKALDEVTKLMKSSIDSKLTVLHISEEKTANASRDNFTPTHALADTSPGFDNQYMGNPSAPPVNKVPTTEEDRHEIRTPSSTHPFLVNAREKLSPHGVDANFIHLSGSEAKRICEYAKEIQADLVVVGSSGKSGMKKWVLGSVSEKVTQHCESSVLVVK